VKTRPTPESCGFSISEYGQNGGAWDATLEDIRHDWLRDRDLEHLL